MKRCWTKEFVQQTKFKFSLLFLRFAGLELVWSNNPPFQPNFGQRSNTELDCWINWLKRPQLLQSVPPSPRIQELLLLVHKLWRKSKKIAEHSVYLTFLRKFCKDKVKIKVKIYMY